MKRRQRKLKQLVLLGLSASLFFQPILAVATAIPTETSESESEVNLDLLKMPELPVVNQQPIESPEVEEPTFHFQKQQLSGQTEESLTLEIKASVATKTFELDLPKSATVVVEELPPGITVKSTADKWLVTSQQVRSTFRIPVSFDASGTFAVTTADDEMEVVIEASEPEGGQEEYSSDVEPTENDITEIEDVDSVETEPIVLPTAEFIGEERPVNTFAEFQAALDDPDVAIISLEGNIEVAGSALITRPLMIKGNGYQIDITSTTTSFTLQDVTSPSTFRLENISLTKIGTNQIPVIRGRDGENWTIELEDVTETVSRMGTASLQLINAPDAKVHFTGGVLTLNNETSVWTYIVARELALSNQARVDIQRRNTANPIWTSDAGTEEPKLVLTGNSQLKIACPADGNTANTLYLQGTNPSVMIDDSLLEIVTGSSPTSVTDSGNNTLALIGNNSQLTIQSGGKIEINTLGTRRGIHMVGTNPHVAVRQGSLDITTGNGVGLNLTASTSEISQAIFEDSLVEFTSALGGGVAITGTVPTFSLNNTQATFTSSDGSQAILLNGNNATMILENHSDVKVISSGANTVENIQIGNNMDSPSLRLSEQSSLTIETTSSSSLATTTANNAIHLRGNNPNLEIQHGATINIHVTSGYRRGVYLQGTEPKLHVESHASLITRTNFDGINLSGDFPEVKVKGMVSAGIEQTVNAAGKSLSLTGIQPELILENGQLFILNNLSSTNARGIELLGANALFEISAEAEISVTTPATRGILVSGDSPEFKLANSLATVYSGSGTTLEVSGNSPQLQLVDAELDINSVSGTALLLSGSDAEVQVVNSMITLHTGTGNQFDLAGNNSRVEIQETVLEGSTVGGHGIRLVGNSPELIISDSEVTLSTENGNHQSILLHGDNALFDVSSQSSVTINSEGVSNIENIAIGKAHAAAGSVVQPMFRLVEDSTVEITTVGGTLSSTRGDLVASFSVIGREPRVEILDSFLTIDIIQQNLDGFNVDGVDCQITISNSQLVLDLGRTGGHDFSDSTALKLGSITIQGEPQIVIKENSEITVPRGVIQFENTQGDTVVSNSRIQGKKVSFTSKLLSVEEQSRIDLITTPENRDATARIIEYEGLLYAYFQGPQEFRVSSDSVVNIDRGDGYEQPAFSSVFADTSKVIVEDGGKLFIRNEGNRSPSDSFSSGTNCAVAFVSGSNNHFIVRGEGSVVVLDAKYGAAISNSRGTNQTYYDMNIVVSDRAHFEANANTATSNGAVINASDLTITFDNPEYLDFRNKRMGGTGRLFSTSANSVFTGINSSLALWRGSDVLEGDPHISVNNIDYEFSGANLQNLTYSSEPEMLNQEMLSGGSLANYRRISSNNKRWAIADELRVPTTADKKIHGHVSIPEGFDGLRSAWDNEVEVVVELQRGNQIEEFVTYTKGYENDYPSLSIYGEEPRPGLFEIQLDDYLQVGDQIRIKEVSLVSGESAGESVVETGTVGVFPIQPPTPALFESDKITSEATSVRGYTDNSEAIVTAVLNQQASDGTFTQSPLDDSLITMAGQGYFDIDLTSLTLFEGDYLQVFLRDKNGSAGDFGVTNPPETNNGIGNINPVEDMVFRDGTFPKATILTVLEMGPLPPVDPLNPVEEVDPENPSEPIHEGVLSIDFVSQFRFGEVAISAQKKDYPALPQRLLNGDGTISEEERPNYVQISNRQASAINWRLSATLQDEGFLNQNDEELRGAQIALGNQQLASTQTDVDSRISIVHNDRAVLLPGVKTDLVKTIDEENQGTWIYRFGNQENAGSSVLLQVPQSANPKTDTYRATISWEISIVPDH
jgi:hypothetical protein